MNIIIPKTPKAPFLLTFLSNYLDLKLKAAQSPIGVLNRPIGISLAKK